MKPPVNKFDAYCFWVRSLASPKTSRSGRKGEGMVLRNARKVNERNARKVKERNARKVNERNARKVNERCRGTL